MTDAQDFFIFIQELKEHIYLNCENIFHYFLRMNSLIKTQRLESIFVVDFVEGCGLLIGEEIELIIENKK